MKLHEDNAKKGDLFTSGEVPYEENSGEEKPDAKVSNLIIPILVLIVAALLTTLLHQYGVNGIIGIELFKRFRILIKGGEMYFPPQGI